ncbi:MAG: ornithine cyclodeaminase family protein [Verrucomicrobiaceae bacterium]|nr:ornithine cyclodeaminase family protein [Verrucomicrobiaceae bacterium]
MKQIEITLLSQQDIISLNLQLEDVLGVVEQAMKEHSAGSYEMHPKIGVHPTGTDPDNFIHAMPAYLKQLGACGLKWVGGFAKNPPLGLPNVTGIQICNDVDTGIPLAVMDCAYLTGLRTAAVSTVIARRCARKDSTELALLGCGFQGGMHLRFLLQALPSIRRVRLYDVRAGAAAELAARTRQSTNFAGEIVPCESAQAALEGADVISTCTNGDEQIIRPEWFKAGAFGVGIEGGCAYTAEALHQADKFIVDDVPLVEYFQKISLGRKNDRGEENPEFPGGIPPVYSTIGDIVAGKKGGRDHAQERIIAIPIGMAICDIALGHLTLTRAREKGVGQSFKLS